MTLSLLNYVPVHVLPLPVYPSLQTQRYEPTVLLHCAFTWQGESEELHSFMSETDINNIPIKLNMKYYMVSRQSLSQVKQKVSKQKWQIRSGVKYGEYVGFLQMPNSKYTLASSVHYMRLILTCSLQKKKWIHYFCVWEALDRKLSVLL